MFRILMILVFVFSMPALSQAQSYGDPSSAAAAEIRFQQLEKEIRRLTGIVEQQNYEIRRLRAELLKAVGDLEVRVNDLEGGKTASPAEPKDAGEGLKIKPSDITAINTNLQPNPLESVQTLGTINKSPDTGKVSSKDAAPRAYEHAYGFIKQRDFANAEKAFAKFMLDFPNSPLVSNAKYWYGETFYVRGSYEKSARIFAEGYKQFPKGSKAASNLLKLGMALSGMGKNDDACVAYKQLKRDYSKSSVPVVKRAQTEMKRINCR